MISFTGNKNFLFSGLMNFLQIFVRFNLKNVETIELPAHPNI